MVVFACNHCNASLKKQVVLKHYQQKCQRNPIFVSCMDCQKDFKDQEFDAHIKCISEVEKYSGKDYVAKPNQNKGEKKQESWTETVQNVIAEAKSNFTDSFMIGVLNKIQASTNVPRKEAKFKNFIVNSFKLSPPQVQKVWQLFANELAKGKPKTVKTPETTDESNGVTTEIAEPTINSDKSVEKKKDKKKKKKNPESEIVNGAKDVLKTVKTSEKVDESNGVSSETSEPKLDKPEEKQKDKKKKRKNLESKIVNGTKDVPKLADETVSEINSPDKSTKKNNKKNKRKHVANVTTEEPTIKKKKMKKNKMNTVTDN